LAALVTLAAQPIGASENSEPEADSSDIVDASGKGQASELHGAALHDEVDRLVARLDDDSLSVRDEAQKRLIDLGPAAIEFVPADREELSAEIRHRLRQIRLELQRVRAKLTMESSRFTLAGEALSLAVVLEELERQTGNRLEWSEESQQAVRAITVVAAFQETPFWTALDQLLDQARQTVYPYHHGSALLMIAADPRQRARSGHAAYAGPFRLEAVRVEALRDLRDSRQGALAVLVEAAWEPRIRPIGIAQPLADVHAVDTLGRALSVADPRAEITPAIRQGVTAAELRLPFVLPARDTSHIAQLRGTLRILMAGTEETFRFQRLGRHQPATERAADVSVELESVRRNNELWELRIGVRYDQASGALESHRGWIFENACYLSDAEGRRIEYVGMETTRQDENDVGIAFYFDVAESLEGYSLIYRTPGSILRSQVDYVLQDIELP
jgi:hypothetical protein